jgi:hypothetical protein
MNVVDVVRPAEAMCRRNEFAGTLLQERSDEAGWNDIADAQRICQNRRGNNWKSDDALEGRALRGYRKVNH